MIDGKKFDQINKIVKFINQFREKEINLILVGDCLQLSPVEGNKFGCVFIASEYD